MDEQKTPKTNIYVVVQEILQGQVSQSLIDKVLLAVYAKVMDSYYEGVEDGGKTFREYIDERWDIDEISNIVWNNTEYALVDEITINTQAISEEIYELIFPSLEEDDPYDRAQEDMK